MPSIGQAITVDLLLPGVRCIEQRAKENGAPSSFELNIKKNTKGGISAIGCVKACGERSEEILSRGEMESGEYKKLFSPRLIAFTEKFM